LSRTVLILGFGVTGRAVATALAARGDAPVVMDDRPTEDVRRAAADLGIDLVEAPDEERLAQLMSRADLFAPSPGVPDSHPAFGSASQHGIRVVSEFDLAQEWDSRPLAAITGTDGKTTVTVLVTQMLKMSGVNAVAVGNTETPLVAVLDDPDYDVFVVEASSFRLGHTDTFRPMVATWLNYGPDHLDVHASLDSYEGAKARIWSDLGPDSVAIGNSGDPTVARNLKALPADGPRVVWFGTADGDYYLNEDVLIADGVELIGVDDLRRQLPHDIDNALAAAATALNCGATLDGVRSALRAFEGLPHRLEFVGERAGVRYFDDSKATAPHATLAAVAGFESVVLIAGGQNKGLDLEPLAALAPALRGVVAIGAAAPEIQAVFARGPSVRTASDMAAAVREATAMAQEGDAVLLSPGCASFDWYGSYGERGDDFASQVRKLLGEDR
jgi:UDP-N-acetylmuramoylalanine--D-glutamate ligase